MRLKIFQKKDKFKLVIYAMFAFIICYMLPNHLSFFKVTYLKMYDFEKMIPFIDWSIWIYMSDYFYIVLAFMVLENIKNINRMFYSFMLFCTISMFIFYFYPTTFPRPEIEYTGLNGFVFKFLHSIDTPKNCMPSLHVGMSYLLSFAYLYEKRKYFFIFFIWATLISISTLTTRQHYFIDIIGGLALAVICLFIFNYILNKYYKELR